MTVAFVESGNETRLDMPRGEALPRVTTSMPAPVQRPELIVADRWREYQLLDCGDGLKQERWGPYTLVRPDPQIVWPRHGGAPGAPWTTWDGYYHRSASGGGRWEFRQPLPEHWTIRYEALGLTFKIRPTSFKHTGLFPEQAVNWEWFSAKLKAARAAGRETSVLNLFGYTGAATVAAAAAGASVCHVDAAEGMVKWCRENAALSGLAAAPVRYIADDCLKFVRRELKRGRRYDAIVMDPPTYGRGSAGELWRLEDNLWELLRECRELLCDRPLFFLVNAYTARLSPTVVANLLTELLGTRSGAITAGEVGLPIRADGKVLPCGIYGRWEAG
jgi:23S rRNA (cytosine1962-C5)-methyltransferase